MPQLSTRSHMLRLLVALEGTQPRIWRRLELPNGTILARLHDTLDLAMGWRRHCPYQFRIRGQVIGLPRTDAERDRVQDGTTRHLDRLQLQPGEAFLYVHDLDRHWRHVVRVEAVFPPEPGVRYPRLLGGAGTCPGEMTCGPEDHHEIVMADAEEDWDLLDSDYDHHWARRGDLVRPRPFSLRADNLQFQIDTRARTYA